MTSILLQNTADASQVLQDISEHHKIHRGLINVIVLFKAGLDKLAKCIHINDLKISYTIITSGLLSSSSSSSSSSSLSTPHFDGVIL
jgi:hypothetical protein